jgi:hypothetical protein
MDADTSGESPLSPNKKSRILAEILLIGIFGGTGIAYRMLLWVWGWLARLLCRSAYKSHTLRKRTKKSEIVVLSRCRFNFGFANQWYNRRAPTPLPKYY